MSDQLPTATRVSDPGIRALYRLENRWQAWLDVEVALARAQAELGIIPRDAAEAIAKAARLELLDRARIDEGFARTGHTIVPLVWELSRVVGEPHGGWVHWGATTQNITQTGDLLVLRQAHGVFLRLIGEALAAMADLAERGAEMPIAGRTHGQHAVPATFGYKVAVWIDELLRHVERLRQAAPRIFVAMLGGGAGTYASLGKQGPPVQAGIARQLGFGTMTVPSRALGDHLAENICLLGMLAATCGKIGREIYTLMKTEFGEVEEPVPPGTVGSSTMPQKRNPKLCQDIIAASAEVRAMVPLALEAMQTEHEADRTTSLIMDSAEARACIETGDMLARLGEVMRGLRLDPARMRRNLDLGGGLIMAEAVMLQLGAAIGRQHAHDVVYDAAQATVVEGRSFADLLAADRRVAEHLDAAAIEALLDPTAYTGLCAEMAHDAAKRARKVADGIAARPASSQAAPLPAESPLPARGGGVVFNSRGFLHRHRRAAFARRDRRLISMRRLEQQRFRERFCHELHAHRQAARTEAAAHAHRRIAGEVERDGQRRLFQRGPFRHLGDARRLGGLRGRHQDVDPRHRRLQLQAQFAASAQRLHIVGGADEAAQRQPVAEQLAIVVEARLHPGLVDRVGLGRQDQPAARVIVVERRQLHLAELRHRDARRLRAND